MRVIAQARIVAVSWADRVSEQDANLRKPISQQLAKRKD